ncbi:MAG: hypothetical protein COS34_00650 [Lysobacterales bacterium CG02_land_8_20_14_3_00_62_12]|nr:MAG: hypothetical protein COS34_00650 [Xanthomonadales bacterium CG02_land_8_20_14_3_00_62_12]
MLFADGTTATARTTSWWIRVTDFVGLTGTADGLAWPRPGATVFAAGAGFAGDLIFAFNAGFTTGRTTFLSFSDLLTAGLTWVLT